MEQRLDKDFLEERRRLQEERNKPNDECLELQEEKEAFERGRRRPMAIVAATVENDVIIVENDA